jgi:SAM-dependent methyltransferase
VVTLPSGTPGSGPHDFRTLAEGFGRDPEHYDRARPRYPQALVERIVASSPGRNVLDVGIGTGIAAQGFRSAGCTVLGVDPDERMAAYARRHGFQVEVARFEEWDPAGRAFDAVVAGQAWHWVDPVLGAAKASRVLPPGGRLAVFWNAMELPPELREALAEAFVKAVPGAPGARSAGSGPTGYQAFFARAADGLRQAGAFGEPERWEVEWEHSYGRDEWLDAMATGGGCNRLDPPQLGSLLRDVGDCLDALGERLTVRYATVAVTAARLDVN